MNAMDAASPPRSGRTIDRRRFAAAAGMLAVLLATFAYRWLTIGDFDNDHFDHVARAYQMRLGDWPVRDFVDPGLPLAILLSAAVHAVLPEPYLAEALIFIPAFALAAALSFRLAWLASGSFLLAAGAVAVQVALHPRSYSYPKLLVYAVALTVGWWAIDRLSTGRLAAMAAATAFAYYFRHDHGVYVGVAMVVLLAVHARRGGIARAGRALGAYAGLVVLFVLPHILYVQWATGVPDYLAMLRDYARAEARAGEMPLPAFRVDPAKGLWGRHEAVEVHVRWVPDIDGDTRVRLEAQYGLRPVRHREGTTWQYDVMNTSAANVRALRADPHVDDTHNFDQLEAASSWRHAAAAWLQPGEGLLAAENGTALVFWLFWLGPAAAAILLLTGHTGPLSNAAPTVAMLVAMAVCVNVGFIRHPVLVRLPDAAVPHTILWAWSMATVWGLRAPWTIRAFGRAALVLLAALVFAAVHFAFEPLEALERTRVPEGLAAATERWRHVSSELRADLGGPMPNGPSRALVPFFRYVRQCTGPDDRLLFAGYLPEAYVLARRGFAGGHLTYVGGFHSSPAEQALAVERMRREQVPFVIVPSGSDEFQQVYSRLWSEIGPRYAPMAVVPVDGGGGLQILVDRSRLASARSSDPVSGWPCLT